MEPDQGKQETRKGCNCAQGELQAKRKNGMLVELGGEACFRCSTGGFGHRSPSLPRDRNSELLVLDERNKEDHFEIASITQSLRLSYS